MDTSPLAFERRLPCSSDAAFAAYVGRIAEWWDRRYTANPETLERVTIEPRVGGRVYATHSDLGCHDWGEVTVWEPGRRLVHSFTLAQDSEHPSEVTAVFDGGGEATLRLVHGGWNESNATHRAKFSDWPVILDRFVALLDA